MASRKAWATPPSHARASPWTTRTPNARSARCWASRRQTLTAREVIEAECEDIIRATNELVEQTASNEAEIKLLRAELDKLASSSLARVEAPKARLAAHKKDLEDAEKRLRQQGTSELVKARDILQEGLSTIRSQVEQVEAQCRQTEDAKRQIVDSLRDNVPPQLAGTVSLLDGTLAEVKACRKTLVDFDSSLKAEAATKAKTKTELELKAESVRAEAASMTSMEAALDEEIESVTRMIELKQDQKRKNDKREVQRMQEDIKRQEGLQKEVDALSAELADTKIEAAEQKEKLESEARAMIRTMTAEVQEMMEARRFTNETVPRILQKELEMQKRIRETEEENLRKVRVLMKELDRRKELTEKIRAITARVKGHA
ncbi:hypothetical protein J8273_2617 [Carpediemonas membranifera]|uniref:Uncharacterized protein n=1 Tax=Carpediemonas membranifera TaxID=201153 RepID=A0A8J6E3K1_9EUKA|nr:hypothetical protein J8273_2617 [Carpediemonas membranifera]|eukprot:KAG9395711.1 hypothetical protein J8273_2617 [Carpediemonas membranifera]